MVMLLLAVRSTLSYLFIPLHCLFSFAEELFPPSLDPFSSALKAPAPLNELGSHWLDSRERHACFCFIFGPLRFWSGYPLFSYLCASGPPPSSHFVLYSVCLSYSVTAPSLFSQALLKPVFTPHASSVLLKCAPFPIFIQLR